MLVLRERLVGEGMRETVRVRNLGRETAGMTLTLQVGADFADLFEVKEGRVRGHRGISANAHADVMEIRQDHRGHSRSMLVAPHGDRVNVKPGLHHVARGRAPTWRVVVQVVVESTIDGHSLTLADARRAAQAASPCTARRASEWKAGSPVVHTTHPGLTRTLARSVEDLGALRIDDAEHPDRVTVAAGAPWFMALFGRDSILASWMTLPIDTRLALGTLQALAERQGKQRQPHLGGGAGSHPARGAVRFGLASRCAVAHRSTTGAPTRHRCSSCSSASCAAGAWPPPTSTPCCRPPTGPWSGSRRSGTVTTTGSSSTTGRRIAVCATRGGRTPSTA